MPSSLDSSVRSNARFAWLLGTTEPPQATNLDLDEFAAACEFARSCWQVLPVVAPRLFAWTGSRYLDRPLARQLQDLAASVKALAGVQMFLCRRFTRELERRQIPYTLLKGSAVRLLAYPRIDLRGGLDVDVGVPYNYLDEAEQVAVSQGFLPASLDASGRHFYRVDPFERSIVEANHYELACLVRRQVIRDLDPAVEDSIRRSIPLLKPWHLTANDEVSCYVTLDVHHGLCLDIEVDPIVESARQWTSDSYSARIPQLEWSIFHLIFKIYWEGVHNYRKGAYQYADLVRLIPQVQGRTALALIDLLSKYRLEAAGYYVLRRIESEFGLSLSSELHSFLVTNSEPPQDEFPRDVNDLGDMWPKIWGVR